MAIAALVVLLGAASALALVGEEGGRAPGDVTLNGVPVGGMTGPEVARVARREAAELIAEPLVVQTLEESGFRLEASRQALDARPQVKNAVAAALEPRSPLDRLVGRLGIGGGREVTLRWTLDRDEVDELVDLVTDRLNRPAVDASVELTDEGPVVVPARVGSGVDPDALRARIMEFPPRIDLVRERLEPAIAGAAARRARDRAALLLEGPAVVTFRTRAVEIDAETIRRALRFEPRAPRLVVRLDPDVLGERLGPAFASRTGPPRDAAFRVVGDSVRIEPSRLGRRLSLRAIGGRIVARPGRPVAARFETVEPEVTTAELRELRITELVSSFSTPYACCQPRVTNIQRAAEILDGMVIPPGGRFSLNEALGERTAERGFVPAPQIIGGRLEDAVGGGVSQIATTIFNAAFFAGLQIETHTPHSFYISRYPAGREATVSYGGPELVFVNDWPAGVLIEAAATDAQVTFRFFSSKLGRRVETETGERRGHVQPRTHEEENPDLEPGSRVVVQSAGGPGFTVSYTRRVYRGEELRRDETYTWTYRPQDAYIELGPPEEDEEDEKDGEDGEDGEEPDGSTRPDEPEKPEAPDGDGEEPGGGGTPTRREPTTVPAPSPLPPPLPPPMPGVAGAG